MVRFCGKKKKEPLCFVTDMFEEGSKKQTDGEASDVFRNINLWMKLISTLNVRNQIQLNTFLWVRGLMVANVGF